MLTIASPKADSVEIDIRARGIQSAMQTARAAKKYKGRARRSPSSTRSSISFLEQDNTWTPRNSSSSRQNKWESYGRPS